MNELGAENSRLQEQLDRTNVNAEIETLDAQVKELQEQLHQTQEERDVHQLARQQLAIQALQDLERIEAAEANADREHMRADTNHEAAVAYRLCVEEAGSNLYHLRDWIKDTKAEVERLRTLAGLADELRLAIATQGTGFLILQSWAADYDAAQKGGDDA